MTEDPRTERLRALTEEAGRALRARARRLRSLPTLAPFQHSGLRRGMAPAASISLTPENVRRGRVPGKIVARPSGIEPVREERSVRALAKEIKRLLTEDRRRGLGLGG